MLVIPLKCPPRYDVREPLARWLDDTPNNSVPANPLAMTILRPDFTSYSCRSELVRLASLRNCLSDSITKPTSHKVAIEEMALPDLHEYHAALQEFLKRGFPCSDVVVSQEQQLRLSWKASIGPASETHGSLEWDRVCAIWNIAALESYLASAVVQQSSKNNDGATTTTTSTTTKKEAHKRTVKHCQMAACMMKYLQDTIVALQPVNKFTTVDLSLPGLKFWEACMLAQAQYATYQVAASSDGGAAGTHHSVLSYLAMAAVPLWNDALKQSKDTLLVSQLPSPTNAWSIHCKSWSMYMSAMAAHHQALAARQASTWGLEIAWLRTTLDQFKSCKDFLSNSSSSNNKHNGKQGRAVDDSMEVSVVANMTAVTERLQQATRDNDMVYGEQVPSVANISTIPPKQLVKSEMDALPETMTTPKVPLFA